eukprot:CAMPEP_0204564924 /NCGR_PEP_ID=MMETSP0661-20131031/35173_1 /ASSEMBLY_ACC=CAM_ASM_000606 /TAXON_ID=109239 /ORGANISM="Alexandrium margalefi, Strain AMGDE01CS-322" /LENGTH=94 /DNA_ID=CAMNT_0051572619 /DNA_START=100 /DNA_END=381 /DNA_ORIENTATION=-
MSYPAQVCKQPSLLGLLDLSGGVLVPGVSPAGFSSSGSGNDATQDLGVPSSDTEWPAALGILAGQELDASPRGQPAPRAASMNAKRTSARGART